MTTAMNATMNRYGSLATLAKFAFVSVGVVVAQGILSLKFQVFAYFDLPLIYCIYYGFTLASPKGSIAIGSAMGLMQDSLSGAALGVNGFSKTLIGFVAATAGTRFDVDQTITRILALVAFTFSDAILKVVLEAVVRSGVAEVYTVSPGTWALSAAFNTLLGLVLFAYRSRTQNAAA